jgi:hypothetical protein
VGRLPGKGKGELKVEGHASLYVTGVLESADPGMADGAEAMMLEMVRLFDSQREKSRAVMGPALEQVKQSLATDAQAPQPMKSAVARANLDKLMDPRGEYDALRKSVKVVRAGTSVHFEMTFPEGMVHRYARFDQGFVAVATVGVLAAVAIPGFVKYQEAARHMRALEP